MKKNVILCTVVIWSFLTSISAVAQCKLPSPLPDTALRDPGLVAIREKMQGRKFWIVPNPTAIERIRFSRAEEVDGQNFDSGTHPAMFVVGPVRHGKAYPWRDKQPWIPIKFENGEEAFLRESCLLRYHHDSGRMFDGVYSPADGPRSPTREYIFTDAPVEYIEAKQKEADKKASDEASLNARLKAFDKVLTSLGNVWVGMSAREARESRWGSPIEVIRTTTAQGVHEFWTFRGGNTMYLVNGVVTAIQD